MNSSTATVTPPNTWTEDWESTKAQVSESTHTTRPTAGPTANAAWKFGTGVISAGWLRALRPADTGTQEPPPAPTVPVSSFTASPESGTAPLAVSFTDTSTQGPTAWAWTFGDGGTSTVQNPTHTFPAGTHTVTLTAINPAGAGTTATRTITVTPPPAGGGTGITVGQSSQAVSTATTGTVTIPKPEGVATGDVLIAQFTADDAPSVTAVPAGWALVVDPLAMGTSAQLFAYHHVVGDAGAEPASYTWGLSTPEKWNGVMTAFRGVDAVDPFETAGSTRVTTSASTTLTVPGVTTVTPGALLVGGVGPNNATVAVTEPGGWTELVEGRDAQVTELAYQARPTVGATGDATWRLSAAYICGGWLRVLRPAR
jgi:PKD repeat protein